MKEIGGGNKKKNDGWIGGRVDEWMDGRKEGKKKELMIKYGWLVVWKNDRKKEIYVRLCR